MGPGNACHVQHQVALRRRLAVRARPHGGERFDLHDRAADGSRGGAWAASKLMRLSRGSN
jgi:hypothetical protein